MDQPCDLIEQGAGQPDATFVAAGNACLCAFIYMLMCIKSKITVRPLFSITTN